MQPPALKYLVDRGLNDAALLGDVSTDVLYWESLQGEISKKRGSALALFCHYVEGRKTGLKPPETRFLTADRLIERTRILIQLAEQMESLAFAGKKKLPSEDKLAEGLGVSTQAVRDAIAGVFIIPEPSLSNVAALVRGEPQERKTDLLKDEHGIKDMLEFSLAHNRLPNAQEVKDQWSMSREKLIETVRRVLVEDIHVLVERFGGGGFNINDVILNRYSFYFREYGIPLYHLWFGTDLLKLYRHFSEPAVEALRIVFFSGNHLNRRDLARGRGSSPAVWIEKLEACEDPPAAIHLLEKVYDIKISPRIRERFDLDSVQTLFRYFANNGLSFSPNQMWFTYTTDSILKLIDYYHRLLQGLAQWDLPLKIRQNILSRGYGHSSLRRIKILEEQAAFFERYGLTPDYYLPYLSFDHDAVSKKITAKKIIGTVCTERRLLTMDSPRRNDHPPVNIPDVTQDRVEALLYLKTQGIRYDDYTPLLQKQYAPEAIARRAVLLQDTPVLKSQTKLKKPVAVLLQRRPVYRTGRERISWSLRYEERDYERYIEGRGLKPPAWTGRLGKVALVQRIREIEDRGLAFTQENLDLGFVSWSWVNLGQEEFQRKITDQRKRKFPRLFYAQLEELYHFNHADLPASVRSKSPDALWAHLRALRKADLKLEEVPVNMINQYGVEAFRDYLVYRLREEKSDDNKLRKRKSNPALTPKQVLLLNQYEVADKLRRVWNNAHDLCVLLSHEEVCQIRSCLEKPEELGQWRDRLEERDRHQTYVVRRLEDLEISYKESEDLMDQVPLDLLAERIKCLKDLYPPVNTQLLWAAQAD